jgi:hypothetical protein
VTDETGDDAPVQLTATVEAHTNAPPDEVVVTLRIVNDADGAVDLLNPDIGRPAPSMNWPWSDDTYRASLLMSYQFLAIEVADESGGPADRQAVETWATPVLRPRVTLQPGQHLDLQIPVGSFFDLAPGHTYEVTVEYGDADRKVSATGSVVVDDRPSTDG